MEVCRLRVGNINLDEKTLMVKAKNKPLKRKIIPQKLIDDLPYLSGCDPADFLFIREGCPGPWEATENNRRDFFSKEFNKVKKHFKLGPDYGIYAFRHTFITKLYRQLRTSYGQSETYDKLMLITGHQTLKALQQYLRDIDAELPEDYSALLK